MTLGTAKPLLITTGEPAGIGAEVSLKAAVAWLETNSTQPLVLIGDFNFLQTQAQTLGLTLEKLTSLGNSTLNPKTLYVLHTPLLSENNLGTLNTANAAYVINTLDLALSNLKSNCAAAMVTAPIHKGVINDGGLKFTGHTEYLAEKTNTAQVVMMLAGGGLRVALATTHLPLNQVADKLSADLLDDVIRIIHNDLHSKFGIAQPSIWVAGLNPHAGENGYLGREEIELINPAIARAQAKGRRVSGSYPADTLFCHRDIASADCVLAMYHDQGLPVLKYASFGKGVNITLGLPIIRTSADHGTALDIAGKGIADAGSMFEAITQAALMANSQLQSKAQKNCVKA